jgi:hypothetical protein
MSFSILYRWFDRRCRTYGQKATHLQQHKSEYNDWEYRLLTDALLSDIWQSWCLFSRVLLLKSIRGTKARDGLTIIGLSRDNSWKRIFYETSQHLKGYQVKANGHVGFKIRFEPTWGDVDVFIRAVQHMAPNNQGRLLTAYGMPLNGIKHMQMIRNSLAHKNVETMVDIRTLTTAYSISKVTSPIDLIWSFVGQTNTFAIDQWLYEINLIADLATESN